MEAYSDCNDKNFLEHIPQVHCISIALYSSLLYGHEPAVMSIDYVVVVAQTLDDGENFIEFVAHVKHAD